MPIQSFDHIAIPIQNTEAMLKFYHGLGFGVKEREHFYSVHFGDQKINLLSDGKAVASLCAARLRSRVVAISVSCGKVRRSRCARPSIEPARKSSKARWSAWAGATVGAPTAQASMCAILTRIFWNS